MGLNEIKIVRTLPVVGGFIKIPHDNSNLPKVNPTEVPFDTLSFGVTRKMTFIEFPEVSADNQENVDYQKVVEDVALAKL
jgi:hypothetical protein